MSTSRRDFLKSAGGIAVAFSWSAPTAFAQQAARPALPGSLATNTRLDGWIRVNPAGTSAAIAGDGNDDGDVDEDAVDEVFDELGAT